MLYRILSGFDPDEYCLISCGAYNRERTAASAHEYLPAPYFDLPLARRPLRVNWLRPWQVREVVFLIDAVFNRARDIIRILRKRPSKALIACSGDPLDIPAGSFAALFLGIPFFAYIFDDYVYQWQGLTRRFTQILAPFIFRQACGVIAPNEFVCEEYRRRYRSNCVIVRNPCDKAELDRASYPRWPAEDGRIVIMYAGAIYHANYDCFRNLAAAVDLVVSAKVEVHIYTAQEAEQLKTQGVNGQKLFFRSHVPYGEILEIQRRADILFLPLAFESSIPEVIRTSAPGKLGEYLASGRPVLAHVPPDSFAAHYLKKHDCAVVADINQPIALAQKIDALIADPAFRGRITQNARRQAEADFLPELARRQLADFLKKSMVERSVQI